MPDTPVPVRAPTARCPNRPIDLIRSGPKERPSVLSMPRTPELLGPEFVSSSVVRPRRSLSWSQVVC